MYCDLMILEKLEKVTSFLKRCNFFFHIFFKLVSIFFCICLSAWLLLLLLARLSKLLSFFCPFIHLFIRPVICPYICPVICMVIWNFQSDYVSSFIKLSDGDLQCKFIQTLYFWPFGFHLTVKIWSLQSTDWDFKSVKTSDIVTFFYWRNIIK